MQVLEPEVNIFYTKNIVEFQYKNASVKVSWFDNLYDLSLDFGIELYKKKLQEQGFSYRLLLLDSLKNFRKYSKVEYTGIQQKKYQSLEFYQEDAKIFIIEQSEIPQNDQMFWKDKNNFIFILPKEETIEKQDVEPTEIAETTIIEPISVEEPSKETEEEKEDSLQTKTDNDLLVKTEEVADVVDVAENNPEVDICNEDTSTLTRPKEKPFAEPIEEKPILKYFQDTLPPIVELKEEEEEPIPTIAITEENIVTIEPKEESILTVIAEEIEEKPILEYSQDTIPSIVEAIDIAEPIPTMDTTGESMVAVEPQEESNLTEDDNAEAESQKSEEVSGKIGLCSNVTYFYPIDWELVSQRNVTPNTWEVILQSGKEEYIIIQEDASFTEQSLLEKENLMVNNIKGIVFDTKIDSLQQDQHRFFYKKFYLNRLCGALVLEQSESDAFLVTIQSFDTVDLTYSSYNYILNHLNENKPKAGSHRTEVGDISFVLPSGYMVSDTIVEKEQTYFKILSPELGTASILFHVYDKDCNLVRLLNLHQMQQKNMFTAFEKIAVSKTAEVMMLYYTSSNEMATYGVTVCMRYKGKTFLIDVFTNALNDTFFDSNHLMNLLNSIDVKS